MATTTIDEPIVEPTPVLDEAPPCWPPVSHIIRKEDEPAREGTIALCGAKLMGIELGSLLTHKGPVCPKCYERFKKINGL